MTTEGESTTGFATPPAREMVVQEASEVVNLMEGLPDPFEEEQQN